MRYYTVTIPIAGHVVVSVEAENEEDAKDLAYGLYDEKDATWETIEQFHQGNVCYCPHPWQVTVDDEGEVEELA